MTLCSQPEIEHRIRGIVLSLSIRYGRAVAERFLTEFERAMRRIQRFPLSGSRLPECRDSELRQVIVWKQYRVFYFVETARGAIWLLNIWHTSQVATVLELPEGVRPSS